MAFDPNDKKMASVLRNLKNKEEEKSTSTVTNAGNEESASIDFSNVTIKKSPKRKPYTYTLEPDVHDKIKKIAENHNYRSASRFLNDFFKSAKE